MTDNEIIKALECCCSPKVNACDDCPFYERCYDNGEWIEKEAIDLINRQKAEIKRLTSGKCVYLSDDETTEYCVEGPCPKYKTEEQTKAEAVKEFAERLKADIVETGDEHGLGNRYPVLTYNYIDNLVKEMVGETK